MHAANHDGLAMLTGARFRALLRFPAQILTVKTTPYSSYGF